LKPNEICQIFELARKEQAQHQKCDGHNRKAYSRQRGIMGGAVKNEQ
jgi:hypothetical protein